MFYIFYKLQMPFPESEIHRIRVLYLMRWLQKAQKRVLSFKVLENEKSLLCITEITLYSTGSVTAFLLFIYDKTWRPTSYTLHLDAFVDLAFKRATGSNSDKTIPFLLGESYLAHCMYIWIVWCSHERFDIHSARVINIVIVPKLL